MDGQTQSDAYEPTKLKHRCAQKSELSTEVVLMYECGSQTLTGPKQYLGLGL